jgi:hypothetical protein
MKFIPNLTNIVCLLPACLLHQTVSTSSTLQNPCIMQKIEVTPNENSTLQDTSIYVCELQGADSVLVEGGVSGSELAVEIKPEDVVKLLEQMENAKMEGVTSIYAQGLAIDGDNKLSFPEGVVVEFDMDGVGRRLGDRDGIHSVLMVRVLASNTVFQHPSDVLSNMAFGTSGDPISLSERYRSCSYGQLLMEPTNNSLATDGVVDITVDMEITDGVTKSEDVVNAVKTQLGALVGGPAISIKETFRHVIMCLPTGTVLGTSPNW